MLTQPYHRRRLPAPQDVTSFSVGWIDLASAHLPPYPSPGPSGLLPDLRPLANALYDARAAAGVSANVGGPATVTVVPPEGTPLNDTALTELKAYGSAAPSIYILTSKCVAAMAYADYFPGQPFGGTLRAMVSEATLGASPGWCGSFGPDVDSQGSSNIEGNYDMTQMSILPLVYNYYAELTPAALGWAITQLLCRGRVRRASEDDILTSGGVPSDWSRAGYVSVGPVNLGDISETENHVLMIATVRYLTNQLLYQRDHEPSHDNRRNGNPKYSEPNCIDQVLGRLRNFLRDDFAEYNAKNYQEETRIALLNLCSYAYDAEVRLGARMVLDHISAHIAVSSDDLRRMVPFRRRDEDPNSRLLTTDPASPGFGCMDVSLLDAHGADPMPARFALLAGNTRAYELPNNRRWVDLVNGVPTPQPAPRPWPWAITPNFSAELAMDAVSSYRLPPSIHDLFVNDLHRRFLQRIHRHPLEEPGLQRNCDNMEIYSGSPSYLITAGGAPAQWVIPGKDGKGYQTQNLGVAVPISFMPTGRSAGPDVSTNDSNALIQLLTFSDQPILDNPGATENYGVGPDFACGFGIFLPAWTGLSLAQDGVFFINRRSGNGELAGFYLAVIKSQGSALLEAFDTWLHPEVTFEQFQQHVWSNNANIVPTSGQEAVYTTYFGNRIHFVIWTNLEQDNYRVGSKILTIEFGGGNPANTLSDAGNDTDPSVFLSGSVMRSAGDGVTEIHNPALGTRLTLDWGNPSHLVRTSEDGTMEQAGQNANGQSYEVWVDFAWEGDEEGDFYRPFKTLAAGLNAVADGGTIKIAPGTTHERMPINPGKKVKLNAPIGGVTIGAG